MRYGCEARNLRKSNTADARATTAATSSSEIAAPRNTDASVAPPGTRADASRKSLASSISAPRGPAASTWGPSWWRRHPAASRTVAAMTANLTRIFVFIG